MNRVITETNQLGKSRNYVYDTVGNLTKLTDRNGRVTDYVYDDLYRLDQEIWRSGTGTAIRTVDFTYNEAGQVVQAQDGLSSYSFWYSRNLGATDRGSLSPAATYFNYGSVSTSMPATYDKVGNRLSLTAAIGSDLAFQNRYEYDNLYRMTSATQSFVPDNGNPSVPETGALPVAAKRVDFSYDTASQLNQITRYEDLAGTKLVATSSFVFDLAGRLTDLTHQQDATVFADYDWDYDAANRLEQFVSSLDGTVDYNYDARDQLAAATYVGQASSLPSDESYTYDDNGNRVLANGATYQTDPNNRLVNDGTYTYLYDDEGNLTKRMKTSDGSYTVYTWDHRNRLTKITDKTSLNVVTKEVTYQYDVFDRRIAKAIDTPASGLQSQVYIYDGAHIAMTLGYNAVSEEYELTNRYLHGPAVDMILADEQISDPAQEGNTLWPLTDNLGSVRDLADYDAATDTTTIANHLVYDSFGNIASETNAAIDHIFGYTGRERDEESDFYFYRGRYYDPKTGRFASEDPIGFAAGDANLNRYVGNNATGAVDPSGMVTQELAGASNVVDATGNPTGSTDCGYVGGGGEHHDDSLASNGSCGSAPQQGLNLRWDPSSGLPPTQRQWESYQDDYDRWLKRQEQDRLEELEMSSNNAQLSEARPGENFFPTWEAANRARFFRESRMGPIRTYLTWMIAPSNATGNQLNFDNYIGTLGGFAPNAMPQGLRPKTTQTSQSSPGPTTTATNVQANRHWWSGRYSTPASQPGAYKNSGGNVFPTRRNSGLSGDALRAEQQGFASKRLAQGHPVEVIRGQAREAGLTSLGRNQRLADRGAENAVQRALATNR